MSCGAARVDPNKCIGCGLCTLKCDFDAIHLYRDRPEMTRMIRTEDKFKLILPYQLKRGFKILANAGTKEAREMRAKRKKFKREMEEFNKQNPNTGNKVVFGESEDA